MLQAPPKQANKYIKAGLALNGLGPGLLEKIGCRREPGGGRRTPRGVSSVVHCLLSRVFFYMGTARGKLSRHLTLGLLETHFTDEENEVREG